MGTMELKSLTLGENEARKNLLRAILVVLSSSEYVHYLSLSFEELVCISLP